MRLLTRVYGIRTYVLHIQESLPNLHCYWSWSGISSEDVNGCSLIHLTKLSPINEPAWNQEKQM